MVKDQSLARMAGNGDSPFHLFAVQIGSLDTNQERDRDRKTKEQHR
jgi:hypothetical protein